jgi:hypothetical protein
MWTSLEAIRFRQAKPPRLFSGKPQIGPLQRTGSVNIVAGNHLLAGSLNWGVQFALLGTRQNRLRSGMNFSARCRTCRERKVHQENGEVKPEKQSRTNREGNCI